jgi:hypothetical protein
MDEESEDYSTRIEKLKKKSYAELTYDEMLDLTQEKYLEQEREEKRIKELNRSPLEAEFLKLINEGKPILEEKLKELREKYDEVIQLSEKYCLAFSFGPGGYQYNPQSYFENFSDLEKDFLRRHSEEILAFPDPYSGWLSSSHNGSHRGC